MSNKAMTKDGLINRIKRAESDQEITDLLAESGSYKEASSRTRNRWNIEARKRSKEIGGMP